MPSGINYPIWFNVLLKVTGRCKRITLNFLKQNAQVRSEYLASMIRVLKGMLVPGLKLVTNRKRFPMNYCLRPDKTLALRLTPLWFIELGLPRVRSGKLLMWSSS